MNPALKKYYRRAAYAVTSKVTATSLNSGKLMAARARGVHLDLLADHCWAPADHDGLLLDYGRVEPSALERALTLIAAELG